MKNPITDTLKKDVKSKPKLMENPGVGLGPRREPLL